MGRVAASIQDVSGSTSRRSSRRPGGWCANGAYRCGRATSQPAPCGRFGIRGSCRCLPTARPRRGRRTTTAGAIRPLPLFVMVRAPGGGARSGALAGSIPGIPTWVSWSGSVAWNARTYGWRSTPWLKERGDDTDVVAVRERPARSSATKSALTTFGTTSSSRPAPSRLDRLRCEDAPEPLAARLCRSSRTRVALVIENKDTFRSACLANAGTHAYAAVIFGEANAFPKRVPDLKNLAEECRFR